MLGAMAGVPEEASHSGTELQEPTREAALAALAHRQHGVVSISQVRALGLTASGVRSRVARGRLHRIHRGVYAVGHDRLTRAGRWMAAVLAYGQGAVLSHRSAAGLWGLRPDNRAVTDVSVPRPSVRSRPGIKAHAQPTLTAADVTVHDDIPCTTVARTLLDLADVVDRRGVERAIDRAEQQRRFDLRAVEAVLGRAEGRRGAGVLRGMLAEWSDRGLTETEIEERFLAACDGAGLRRPEANVWLVLGDRELKADFLWSTERLVVETDGRAAHLTRAAFERDRRRDQSLLLAGYRVVRFTWPQVTDEPERGRRRSVPC